MSKTFKSQLADYLDSSPAVRLGGRFKFVVPASVREMDTPYRPDYQIAFTLADRPAPGRFEAALHTEPYGLADLDSVTDEVYFCGFGGRYFDDARRAFERAAADAYVTADRLEPVSSGV